MSWQTVKLGDVCDLFNGYAFKANDYVEFSNVLNCRMSNIRPTGQFEILYHPKYLPDNFKNEYEKYLLTDDDVIIAMTDLAGEPKILGMPTIVKTNGKHILLNQRVGKLIFKDKKKLDVNFLKHVLSRPQVKEYYKKFAGGGLQINLGKQDLLSIEIPLPPLAEQKRIAEILNKANEIKVKRELALAKLDELARSTFIDMFGDPEKNSLGWKYSTLNDLVTKLGDGLHGTPTYCEDGEYDFINGNNLHHGVITTSDVTKKVSINEFNKHKKELNKSTMLVSINGTIGKVAFYNGEKIILGKSVCYFNVNESLINKTFLFYLIENPYFVKYATSTATGSTIKNVSLKSMRNFPIPMPPLALQEKFSKYINNIEATKSIAKEALIKQKNLLFSLQNQAFTTGFNA